MFKSLKLYSGETLDLENTAAILVDFGYKKQEAVGAEGDFSRRGAILDIFPFTFELPIRVELEFDKINSIKSFNPVDGSALWEHKMALILPARGETSNRERFCI